LLVTVVYVLNLCLILWLWTVLVLW